jgi:hypothetical protein
VLQPPAARLGSRFAGRPPVGPWYTHGRPAAQCRVRWAAQSQIASPRLPLPALLPVRSQSASTTGLSLQGVTGISSREFGACEAAVSCARDRLRAIRERSRFSRGAARARRTLTVTSSRPRSPCPVRFPVPHSWVALAGIPPGRVRGLPGPAALRRSSSGRGPGGDAAGSARGVALGVQDRPGGVEQPNKAQQLTRRRIGACKVPGRRAAGWAMDSSAARRSGILLHGRRAAERPLR